MEKLGDHIWNHHEECIQISTNMPNINSMDIVIGLCHDDRIDIDTFSESVESSSKLS